MKWFGTFCLSLCSIVLATNLMARADQPSTQPSDHGSSAKSGARWGFTPYNKLSTLTEEQKQKIIEIHQKFLADRKALEDKQDADVMALLTDEQKAELDKLKADEKAHQAERRRAARDAEKDKPKDEQEKDK